MSKVVEIKETKEPLTLEQFVSMGKTIADIYKDDEEEQAKAIGRYFDSVCRTEKR
jgi:hypothetical protein